MSVLVDTSVWIDYFRSADDHHRLDILIDENIVVTNDLILAELIPFLKVRKQNKIIELLKSISNLQLQINWDEVIEYQIKCLKKGINGIGIPDLIIAQSAKQNDCEIYSLDSHFKTLSKVVNIKST